MLSTLLSGVDDAIASLHYDREKTRHSLALVSRCPSKECTRLHEISTLGSDHMFINCSKDLCFFAGSLESTGLEVSLRFVVLLCKS